MKILFIGDIVAKPGRQVIEQLLPQIISENNIDLVVANAENAAHGRGVTSKILEELMNHGINFFTSGDHIFHQADFLDEIDNFPILRPANYPEGTPGKGHDIINAGKFGNILIINLMGRVFLNERLDDPFRTVDQILEENKDKNVSLTLVDFHAECSSEKYALAFYLDGRVDAIVGTHTHVPTCDHMVLPNKTLFVSDVGMTGIVDSVLGVEKNIIIDYYLSATKQRFEWESAGRKAFRGVILDTDERTINRYDRLMA